MGALATEQNKTDVHNANIKILLIERFLSAYDTLKQASGKLSSCIHGDKSYPLFLPTYPFSIQTTTERSTARTLAAKSLCQTFNLDNENELVVRAGILCASPETLDAAVTLNNAKQAFKQAVLDLRKLEKAKNRGVDTLIEQILPANKKNRPKELVKVLKNSQLSRLNLTRCYSKVRILDNNMESVSWTWATTHSTTHLVTCATAREQAKGLPDTSREVVLSKLAHYDDDYEFSYLQRLPNRLQANTVYREEGEVKRKPVVISGVALCPGNTMPRVKWRDDPGSPQEDPSTARLKRSDAKVSDEEVIYSLHLYKLLKNIPSRN
ncbi:MAG: hypothetical protein KUG76_05985 [Gammaproteobacteria bacterium]|nr:hypothetical protein [Gammaproteobacteria bacterium]